VIIEVKDIMGDELPINNIILGDALEALKKFPDNSVDAVVTDPPYGLRFMNQKWDYDVPSVELWREVLRVMKPGAHLLSFFGTRTYHRGVVNIEDAGFEIRDMIQWLYGEGFPKSMDISKAIDKEFGKLEEREVIGKNPNHRLSDGLYKLGFQGGRGNGLITAPATPKAKKWQGWGTALKPACEPIVLARKPISERNIAQNVLKWGTGGLNIDGCRIPCRDGKPKFINLGRESVICYGDGLAGSKRTGEITFEGRFPANVIIDEEAAKMLDEQSGVLKSGTLLQHHKPKVKPHGIYGEFGVDRIRREYPANEGGASRFFYVAKAGRDERFAYCQDCGEVLPQKEWEKHKDHNIEFHVTVKPLKLKEYLVRLITPPSGVVLDPFFGTGTTGVAALKQGFRFIGIEINEPYAKIAEHRLKPHLAQQRMLLT